MSSRIVFPICTLLTMACLWPSEGAIAGDGVHLVFAWLCVGAITLLRGGSTLSKVDVLAWLPVVLLMFGFWLSTWHVFDVHGDRRAALNLAFEWTAVGIAWWLVRQLNLDGARAILVLIVALGVGASTLGIAQYHVANKKQAEWYLAKRESIATASPGARKLLEADLQQAGVPLDGSSRELFERRLLSSSEPVGPFALANTLGGVLAVALVLLLAGVLAGLDRGARNNVVFWISSLLLIGIVGYCLVLTKSRTAWVGSLAGFMFLLSQRSGSLRVWLKRAALTSIVVIAAGGVGVVSGAIDREVVLESPKSLQYRLFYWIGAAGVIKESPIYGAGPGNFRQAYLAYKVPESSEEILDPHNIFVDAWCSAGAFGFLAIVLLVVGVLWRGYSRRIEVSESISDQRGNDLSSRLIKPVVAGFALTLTWRWIGGGPFWDFGTDFFLSQNLILLIPTGAIVGLVLMRRRLRIPPASATAAFVCLLVHLLGAGGLQISICGLLLLVLHAVSFSKVEKAASETTLSALLRRAAFAGVVVVIFSVANWGVIPVAKAKHQLQIAAAKTSLGDKNAASLAYRQAITNDWLSAESRQQNAEFLAYLFVSAAGQYAPQELLAELQEPLEAKYLAATNACAELIESDRRAFNGYLLRAQLIQVKADACVDSDALIDAVGDLKCALELYPTNAKVWSELALLCKKTGQAVECRTAAERALFQEKINRSWGHADRYLSADVLQSLREIRSSDVVVQ